MRIAWRRAVASLAAAAMAAQTGCYSLVPVAAGVAPSPGERVRVRLTVEGTTAMSGALGPRVEWAEGTLSERRSDGSMVIGVGQVRLLDGVDHFWTGQGVVTFDPAHVAEVQRRSLDRGRTRIATIALSVGMVLLAVIALGSGGASGDPGDGGVQPPP